MSSKWFQCCICNSDFSFIANDHKTPIQGSCGHSFCKVCISMADQLLELKHIICPLCNQKNDIHVDGLSPNRNLCAALEDYFNVKKEELTKDEITNTIIKKTENQKKKQATCTTSGDEIVINDQSSTTRSKGKKKRKKNDGGELAAAATAATSKKAKRNKKNSVAHGLKETPKSVTAIVKYMDELEPTKKYYARQKDTRNECSKTRKKMRDFARTNPTHPAVAHWVESGKVQKIGDWQPPDQETLNHMIALIKTMIK